jgi:hypothetical protein
MRPKNNSLSGCTQATGSDCITWTGPDIPCLGITQGMSITDTENIIACKVCELAEDIDVSTVDLSCLIAQTNYTSDQKNVKLILELLLENQCSLKELIDNIDTSGDGTVELNLNLKCLKKFDDFGNEIPQDLNQTLQSIINQVCQSKDDITILQSTVVDLQDQIDNLPDPPPPYEEPTITTCVAVAKPLSDAVILLSNDYCTYKTNIGTPTQIQGGISQQCDNLNAELGSEVGWNLAPQNIAQTVSNMWITICNLRNRIRAMEQTCCAPSCDKIKIGFTTDFDFDNKEVTLNFISGAGTSIPAGFVDCGTVLTITDKNNVSLEFTALNIAQGVSVGPLSLIGLSQGTLTFNFKTKFCLVDTDETVILTCQDCVVKEAEYSDTGCCIVTNTSSEAITIVIDTCVN